MNEPPVISIIIVTYNAAQTLQKCLDSIYNQPYPSLKIIIIDGASSDGTVSIIRANLNKLYYWESEKDDGIYFAMNKALKKTSGEWVYFLGADDELYPDFSRFALELRDKNAIYYANVQTAGVLRSGELTPYQMAKHGIFHQAMIYPAWVLTKYSFDTKYKIVADYALNMKCWKDRSIRFIYKNYVIAHFNHTGVSGSMRDEAFEKDKSSLIIRNFGFYVWIRYMMRLLKKSVQ